MIIKGIKLKNFRNCGEVSLDFTDGTTVFNGKNAQGKTNMLEALYMPVTGRSFRTVHESEFIKNGETVCEAEAIWNDGTRDKTVTFRWVKNGGNVIRYITVNRVPIAKMSELFGTFRGVLFCPEDLYIVKGGPSERRRFLDMAISHTSIKYLRALQKYNSILAERNALLKEKKYSDEKNVIDIIEPWNLLLSEEAERLSAERYEYIKLLDEKVKKIVSDMAGDEVSEISYHNPKSRDEYFAQLTENIGMELRAGMTLYGIHRDDISVTLNGKDARIYCSQGQQRTLSLAMKTAEGEIIKDKTGDSPVYMYDDILSELDASRRKYLLDGISNKQVFITSCDKIETKADVIFVDGGRYERR